MRRGKASILLENVQMFLALKKNCDRLLKIEKWIQRPVSVLINDLNT